MLALGLALRGRVAAVAEAVFSMEPMRVLIPAGQRPVGARTPQGSEDACGKIRRLQAMDMSRVPGKFPEGRSILQVGWQDHCLSP